MKIVKHLLFVLIVLIMVSLLANNLHAQEADPFPNTLDETSAMPGIEGRCSEEHPLYTNADVIEITTFELNLRTAPGLSASILTHFEEDDRLSVIGGPRCISGYTWYNVATDNGGFDNQVGWVAYGRPGYHSLVTLWGQFVDTVLNK